MKHTSALLGLVLLGACASSTPFEQRPRPIDFTWQLTPEAIGEVETTGTQGTPILKWEAVAKPTHLLASDSGRIASVAAATTYGYVYCPITATGNISFCYEDTDADEMVDRKWQRSTMTDARMGEAYAGIIRNPEPLAAPMQITELDDPSVTEAQIKRSLALIYAIPSIAEFVDGNAHEFKNVLGSFMLGWLSDSVPMRPDGSGFEKEVTVPFLLAKERPGVKTKLAPLGLEIMVTRVTVEGEIEATMTVDHPPAPLEFSAKTRQNFSKLSSKDEESGTPSETSPMPDADIST